MSAAVTAVIVSFSDPAATQAAVDSLLGQTEPPVEVIVVDNDPGGSAATALRPHADDRVRVVHPGSNLGYAAACNLAADQARGDWLFFFNPDARADPGCLHKLLAAADGRTGVIGAQVLLPDGRANAGDNPVHITGMAWAGRFGEPRESGPPRRVASVSGAALLARTSAYRALGGLCEPFFMYYDDTDLCWRMRLGGWDVTFCPEAVVWHDYEFDKGGGKWSLLDRNRLWSVLSNYSRPTLLMLLPLLVGTELAVAARAVSEGWLADLVRAWAFLGRRSRELRTWRTRVQRSRRVSDSELLGLMTGTLETQLVRVGPVRRFNHLVEIYRRAVLGVLRTAG